MSLLDPPGDCIGSQQFTHYAGWQAFMAVRNMALPGKDKGTSLIVPRYANGRDTRCHNEERLKSLAFRHRSIPHGFMTPAAYSVP
jgi:hypothetical protein